MVPEVRTRLQTALEALQFQLVCLLAPYSNYQVPAATLAGETTLVADR